MNCSMKLSMSEELRVYGSVLGGFLAILSTTGNTLVVLAIYRTAALQNITNYFLASLAVADFLVGVVALPVCLAWWSSDRRSLRFLAGALYMQSLTASTYNLCAVSIDRYIAIRNPLRYHSVMTVKTFWRIISFVWILSILTGCIRFTIDGNLFWLVTIILVFMVPFVVITYCYVYMLKEARRQNRDTSERTVGEMAAQAQNHKAAVTVGIVIGVFLLFTLPVIVVRLAEAILDVAGLCVLEKTFERGSSWVLLVSFSNSVMNPLIYAVRKKEFREAFKKIFFKNTAQG